MTVDPSGVTGSNPARGLDACSECSQVDVCVCRSDHSSRGVLPSVVCLECYTEPQQ
jgi:hypothetical protein